jgi:hypothetical protein
MSRGQKRNRLLRQRIEAVDDLGRREGCHDGCGHEGGTRNECAEGNHFAVIRGGVMFLAVTEGRSELRMEHRDLSLRRRGCLL